MKRNINSILSVLITFSLVCTPMVIHAQGYEIDLKINNSADTIAYLGHHFATNRYLDDTAKVQNGQVIFKGNQPLKEGIYFYYSPAHYFEFLIGEQTFSLETTPPDYLNNMKVKNSLTNEGFYKLQLFTSNKRKATASIKQLYDSAKTDAEKEKYKAELKSITNEVVAYQKELSQQYAGTLLEKLIRVMQTPEVPEPADSIKDKKLYRYLYYKNHFWDGIDITDPGLLRTPILDAKIKEYLDDVVIQQSDSVIKEVDLLITKASASKEAYRYLLITLINKYEASPVIDFDKVFVHIVEQYYLTGKADEWTTKETLEKLQQRVNMIKPNFLGNDAPQLILWDTLGNKINLRDIDAKFTVLYFYDPDCGHCQRKTPILYEQYPEMQAKGVEILGICTGTDEKKWKDFIKNLDLGWINLADLQSQTYVKYFYDVRSTPTVYILDKDKKIILKKIDALDIPKVIDQLLEQESKLGNNSTKPNN